MERKTQQHSAPLIESQGLRALSSIDGMYILPRDPLADAVLIPAFRLSSSVDCMIGFFSSAALADLAPGLATFINKSNEKFRLVINPLLSAEDIEAIRDGTCNPESVVTEFFLGEIVVTEDLIQQHTLKCLSYLLYSNRLEIKIAIMKDGLFHPKVWLFYSGDDVLAVHGSSNATHAGITKNLENIATSKSWNGNGHQQTIKKLQKQFSLLWEENDDNCLVVSAPDAVKERLLKSYHSMTPPTEDDLKSIYTRAKKIASPQEFYEAPHEISSARNNEFIIPKTLNYSSGPFAHQGEAVEAWCNSEFKGVLEMATGSGKTITSMICAHHLHQKKFPLLIVIAAPYIPLVEQWAEEVLPFGLFPVNLTNFSGDKRRSNELQKINQKIFTGISDVEVVIVSHDTLCNPVFHNSIKQFECNKLLIADEVHNLGSPSFLQNTPEFFEYRLGLSATPVRQYDEDGTKLLFDYFGKSVFTFSLNDAIGLCLVEYEYYVHPVYLTSEEMGDWHDLTEKIKSNFWRQKNDKPDQYLSKLLRDRRALLETAKNKIDVLNGLLTEEDISSIKHTLIYATDKDPNQLVAVNKLLEEKGIIYHQLTADETGDRKKTGRIIGSFQEGDIQILTAKRVLDEGVNIPQICKAYILASTTVERQWVQRRGRVLRTCNSIDKRGAIIHDFIALPPDIDRGLDSDARSVVKSEMRRVREFARLARNAGKPDGPIATIDRLIDVGRL